MDNDKIIKINELCSTNESIVFIHKTSVFNVQPIIGKILAVSNNNKYVEILLSDNVKTEVFEIENIDILDTITRFKSIKPDNKK